MLIGLSGKAGAGKDTAGLILCEHYGFARLSFADNIKTMLASVGIIEPCRADKEKKMPGFAFSYRKAAQILGTEIGRNLDPDLWVKLLEDKIENCTFRNIVVTDVRFKNEVRLIQKLNGKVVEIQGRQSDLGSNSKHASEAGIPEKDIDLVIQNDGTIEELKFKLCKELLC